MEKTEQALVTIPARGSFVKVLEGSAYPKTNIENPSLLDVFARMAGGAKVLLLRAAEAKKAFPLINNINENGGDPLPEGEEFNDLFGAITCGHKKYRRKG